MMTKISTIDLGGSSIKAIDFIWDEKQQCLMPQGPELIIDKPDYSTLWSRKEILLSDDSRKIGISSAGSVDHLNGVIENFTTAKWINKPIVSAIATGKVKWVGNISSGQPNSNKRYSIEDICLLNDGEAHLMAHHDLYEHPQLCLSLGSGVGFGLTDNKGHIMRAASNRNFEISLLQTLTMCSNNQAWYTLGGQGFKELECSMGLKNAQKAFGLCLGQFIAEIVVVFQPRTIVLSGGISESQFEFFSESMRARFFEACPEEFSDVSIYKSPYGRLSALWGMAKCTLGRSEFNF